MSRRARKWFWTMALAATLSGYAGKNGVAGAPATGSGNSPVARKLDVRQWKHRVPLVVRNQTQRSVSNVVTMVEIEIRDGMKPDIGDVRLTDENGFEQPVLVANVVEYFRFILLFAVDLPAGGQQKLFLLYGNPQADRRVHRSQPLGNEGGRARLNLADTSLNCIPNHGFEEGLALNPKLPAGWDCRVLPSGEGTGRLSEDACSGSWSMCIYAATGTTNYPWMAVWFSLSEPLRRGQQMVHAASSKSRNLSPRRGATAGTQIPGVVGVGFPQYDYDWMTSASVFTASKPARKPVAGKDTNAVPAKPATPEDDVVLFKNIRLLVGASYLPAGGTVWFDDIFLARFIALDVDVGK